MSLYKKSQFLLPSLLTVLFLFFSPDSFAKPNSKAFNDINQSSNHSSLLLAQYETSEDAYDPFADYSEFEESADEEADINFFKNGRFLTIGFLMGQRDYTDILANITTPALSFGASLSYFFDLRFAIQATYLTGQHQYDFITPTLRTQIKAASTLSTFSVALKYYLNTQDVTKGLANMNPYFFGGFSQVTRTASSGDQLNTAKETAVGFDVGAGIEIPILQNSMYAGLQGGFHLINFKDEAVEIVVDTEDTDIFPKGDAYSILVIMGVNF